MQHIDRPSNDFKVSSGWNTLVYALPSWIDSMVLPNVGVVMSSPTLKSGYEWMRISFTNGSLDFGDDAKPSEHGAVHQVKIVGFVPRTDAVAVATFAEMVQHEEFILKVRNNDHEYRLIGLIGETAKFSYKESNANRPGNRKGLMFEFVGEFSRSPFFLQ